MYLGDSNEGKYIFEDRAKPAGMTDRLDICCEENERVKDNSKYLDSADYTASTQLKNAFRGIGGEEESRICLGHV